MIALWGAGFLLAGLLAGWLHFHLLHWNTQLFVNGGMARAFAVQVLRLVALAAVLVGAAWQGALPLLLAAIGVMIARHLVMRRARAAS
jgi:F1F0 ATPase subunit 2